MRIALVNWARIEHGASLGGGVNGYAQGLALELARKGHEVHWLCSGTTREPDVPVNSPKAAITATCFIRRHADWHGIQVHEVINSPVRAPSLAQAHDPLGEVTSPALAKAVGEFWQRIRPDIVHIHNVEGFSLDSLAMAADVGAKLIWSLHNYHSICPQVYLMQHHRTPCLDDRHGRACESCLSNETAVGQPQVVLGPIRRVPHPSWPDCPLRPGPWWGEFPDDWAPLENTPPVPSEAAAPARRDSSPYYARRRAMIDALNACDRVLAVSNFVLDRFVTLGVSPDKIQVQHIGTRFADESTSQPTPRPRRVTSAQPAPLRLMFMGYHNHFKGLHVLLDALELLVPEVLARIHLTIRALNAEHIERPVRRLQSRLASLSFGVGYEAGQLRSIIAHEAPDLGVVPSIWWDNGPQTVMEFLSCGVPVLGARAGGIPDLVHHAENGLLFRANDRYDLARTLVKLTREPELVDRLRAGVRKPKGMIEHATEMENLYTSLLHHKGQRPVS